MATDKPTSIQEYFESLPVEITPKFTQLWEAIKAAAPEAEPAISYNMPALKLNGKFLVSTSAFKNHMSLFPFPAGDQEFEKLAAEGGFDTSGKGTIQFPYDKELPFELIEKIVKRQLENSQKEGGY